MILTRIPFQDMPPTNTLFQSGFWADFRHDGKTKSFSFLVDTIPGMRPFGLVALVRTGTSGDRYAYVPRGPEVRVTESERGLFLESLSAELKPHLPSDLACIRYDNAFLTPFTDSEYWTPNGQWKGAPRRKIRELRMNYGTRSRKLRKEKY